MLFKLHARLLTVKFRKTKDLSGQSKDQVLI